MQSYVEKIGIYTVLIVVVVVVVVVVIIIITIINYSESSLTSGYYFWYINTFRFAISNNFILYYYVKNPTL